MKATILTLFFFLFIQSLCYSQSEEKLNEVPFSVLDVGVGIGTNYGIFGGKFVLGCKGNGLMVGAGSVEGTSMMAIGFQFSYKFLFFNISNADYGLYSVTYNNKTEEGTLNGTVFMFGGKGGIGKNKRLFVELGFGVARGGKSPSPFGPMIEENQRTFSFGLGYRIG